MRKVFGLVLCFLGLGIVPYNTYAQGDSTTLLVEKLKAEDIRKGSFDVASQKVVSASRSLQAIEDLPFTIYVITKEDIRNNGYNTLVDALKMVPGIRVSQPGSGTDGETFMMRGLRGNSYTKILVNNVAVKPIGVKGMPIGAQLPIRQAERIEVIFGPAATLYGADASAGVINIILKESERPLYTKADISVGTEGYSAMNILFGGKAGKGKKILKYNVFGNFTTLDNRLLAMGYGDLYRYKAYDPDTNYINHPNFNQQLASEEYPVLGNIPHQSRLFGMQLRYRAFDLTVMKMYRRDHSSIGLNPAAFSYENPLNYVGENINHFHLGYSRKKKKHAFNIALNAIVFESDENSSYRFLNSEFNRALVLAAESDNRPGLPPLSERLALYYDNFITGDRYIFEQKIDVSLEATWNLKLLDKLEWMFGVTPRALLSTSEHFLKTPYPDFYNDHTVTSGGHTDEFVVGGFTQFFYNGIKMKVMAGIQSTYSTKIPLNEGRLFPRLGVLYKLTSSFSLRAFYGTAFRTPSTYFSKNSYTINVGEYNWVLLGDYRLKPEITKSFELGLRLSKGAHFYADISFFNSETTNIITADTKYERNDLFGDLESITLGYFNEGEDASSSNIFGLQSAFVWRNNASKYKLNASLFLTLANGLEHKKGGNDFELKEQPKVLGQLKLSFAPWKRISIHLNQNYLSKTQNGAGLTENNKKYSVLPAYYSTDVSIVARLTDHFQVNFNWKNIFNAEYSGLAATRTSDDLIWNPQSLRTLVLGFSYRME